MAINNPRNADATKLIAKAGQLGELYTMFERERIFTGVSANTVTLYEWTWKFFAPTLEPLQLTFKSLNVEQRKEEERKIIRAIKQRRDQRIAQGDIQGVTLNTYQRNITTFINWLRDEEQGPFLMFDHSDALKKLRVTETPHDRTILKPEQIERFAHYRPGDKFNQMRVWTMGLLMLDCGIRIDEALDLQLTDVDLTDEMIFIQHGKGGKSRHIPIGHNAAHHLMKYKIKYIDAYRETDQPWHFFGTHAGQKMSQRNALRDLKVVLKKAGVITRDPASKQWKPALSWHNFRHTTATVRLENGESLDKVQRLLGHRKSATTERYLHRGDNYLKVDHDRFSPLQVATINRSRR